jgi:nucleoside-diphosphate-sugar epimerase
MKVLITGGAGYIGTVLTPMLLERGHSVRCYDRLMYNADPVLPFFRDPRYELVQGDVRDGEKLKRSLWDVDAIIHLAAIVGYPACRRDTELAQQVNVLGTRTLNLAHSPNQPLVFASTGSNYGAVEGVCTEETPLNPLTVYGRTKTEAEKILLDTGNVVAYRFATAFGLSPRLRLDLLVNDYCYQAVQNRSLILYEAHFQRTFIHVHDIARAFVHALNNYDTMRDQVYNCGDNRMNASKLEIAKLIQQQTNFYLHLAEIGKDKDQRNYKVCYDKIQATGYRTTVTLEAGTSEMIRAFQFLQVRNSYRNG